MPLSNPVYWGVANLSEPFAARIRLCNKAALLLFVCSSLFSLFVCTKCTIDVTATFWVESVLFLTALLLNKFHFYDTSRLLLLSALCIATYLLSGLLGQTSYIFLFYFAGVVGPFALFLSTERWQQVVSVSLATGLVILDLIFQYHLFSEQADKHMSLALIRFFTVPGAFVATFIMIFSLLRDIQRVEQQASRNQQKLETIVTSLNEVVYEIDENYRIIDVWASDEHLLPAPRSTQKYVSIQAVLPANEYQRFKELIDEALYVGVTGLYEYCTADSQIWYQARIVPTRNIEGAEKRVSLSLVDVTAEKKVERNYREALLVAKESAELATQEKSNFLSVMSHEIRTPLNAVIGLSDLLLQESPRPDQETNLSTLKFSAESLLALINDILDFSKIEAGKISLESVPFDLQTMIRSVVASMDYQAEDKGIQLRCNIDERLPYRSMGDPTRLSQILNNLVSNAVKFTREGYVEVKVEVLDQDEKHSRLQLSVIDTGIGIASDKRKEIFRFFSQADNSVTREFGGTGLGLSITRSLLSLYDSEVTLVSEPNIGSIFTFELTLPVAERVSNKEADQNYADSNINLQGLRVLLVDDNRVNILVAMKLLSRWGAIADMAEDGERALAMVKENDYDVILMDIQMPGMDGYETTQAIRAIPGEQFKRMPIIALTATVIDEVHRKAKQAGLNAVLPKPIRPAELKRKMASVLLALPVSTKAESL